MTDTLSRSDVVVVGAGFAGLVAAHTLEAAGRSVTCLEARDRVGGRAWSIDHEGVAVDVGATWFWHNEPLIASLIDQLGLKSFDQPLLGDAMFESTSGAPQRLAGNPIDAPAQRFTAGAQSLAVALSGRLKNLQLQQPVRAIQQQGEELLVCTAAGSIAAKHVVLALPPSLAVNLIEFTPELPEPLREVAMNTQVWMGDMIKAIAVYETAWWRDAGLSGSAISYRGPFQEFHDISGAGHDPSETVPGRNEAAPSRSETAPESSEAAPDANGAENRLGVLFAFARAATFPQDISETDIAEIFRNQLVRIWGQPAAAPQHVYVTNWSGEKYTSPHPLGGQASTRNFGHPLFQQPAEAGRIHWASTETATAFAGHLEGAARAGLAAAQRIEALLAAA